MRGGRGKLSDYPRTRNWLLTLAGKYRRVKELQINRPRQFIIFVKKQNVSVCVSSFLDESL